MKLLYYPDRKAVNLNLSYQVIQNFAPKGTASFGDVWQTISEEGRVLLSILQVDLYNLGERP
jgi:hypothetical protein